MIRPPNSRDSRLRIAAVLLLALGLASGCSTKRDKILGNERLLRGDEGFGTTTRSTVNPDRDTYASPGTANFGPTLVVGASGTFEARSFFRVSTWSIPDTNDVSVVIQSITFEARADTLAVSDASNLFVTVATTAGPPELTWPGVSPFTELGTAQAEAGALVRIPIALTAYDSIRAWAATPSRLPGLMLYYVGGTGVIGLEAGKAVIKIAYTRTVSGSPVPDTLTTATSDDFYLHPLDAPVPTGSETTLVLGGLYEEGVPIRFPATPVAEGSTVNEATLRLRVSPSSPIFPTGRSVVLEVRRLKSAWLETVTGQSALDPDTSAVFASATVAYRSAADSVISITLPQSIVRDWTAAGGLNEGLLVTARNGNRAPRLLIGSRESSLPAELRVSITTPPPGRF
ncbi:MAG TPA: DNRLRE domain-containing protein [Acidobacteriota bacterium]|nr:DNRLRE domain-containing protein [Acidobacteriota bacterium]